MLNLLCCCVFLVVGFLRLILRNLIKGLPLLTLLNREALYLRLYLILIVLN
jgi:hypothetical protein